ncbi:hypothetical protein, partial [Brevibacillus laterosporus]|uniref:hypothetical protein n=1 Tax=Brevibacillus laterosporus TaxID=1465 RepID=UPI00215C81AD
SSASSHYCGCKKNSKANSMIFYSGHITIVFQCYIYWHGKIDKASILDGWVETYKMSLMTRGYNRGWVKKREKI